MTQGKDEIPEEYIERISSVFKAFGHPLRLKIVRILRTGEKNVKELTELLNCSQANISKHLKVLQENNILERKSEGTSSIYRLAGDDVLDICSSACDYIQKVIEKETEYFNQVNESGSIF
ncbi:MAG: ArsR/SmtB family transcription factor [bacterium]